MSNTHYKLINLMKKYCGIQLRIKCLSETINVIRPQIFSPEIPIYRIGKDSPLVMVLQNASIINTLSNLYI